MKNILIAITLLFLQLLGIAQDKEYRYYVFPVKGITGISRSALNGVQNNGPKYGGMIDSTFADEFFPDDVQAQLNLIFQQEVQKKFSKSIVGANQISEISSGNYAYQPTKECSADFKADYRDSFAVSIGINRLSVYKNIWGKYIDLLIPVTYSIRFVQLSTGELAFTRNETIYTRYSNLANDVIEPGTQIINKIVMSKLANAVRNDAIKIIASLVDQSSKSFTAKQSTIEVVGRDGKYIIFNSGSEVGFSSGSPYESKNEKNQDLMFDIVYASKGVAIAIASDWTPEVKKLSDSVVKGEKLSFVFTQQGKDDAKPTILAPQYLSNYVSGKSLSSSQILNNSLISILVDNIGFDAPFIMIKHDPDFNLFLGQVKTETICAANIYEAIPAFSRNSKTQRLLPDYFLKLESFGSPSYTAWGVGKVSSNTVFNTSVTLSLIDRSGVLRQSFLANNAYSLKRDNGVGLSYQDATEVNLKNSTLDAAQILKSKFVYKSSSVAIKSVAKDVLTLSSVLPASSIDDAKLVHPVSFSGKTVLVPIPSSDAKIAESQDRQDSDKLEFKGKLTTSDLIQLPSLDFKSKPVVKCEDKNAVFLQNNLNVLSKGESLITPLVLQAAKGLRFLLEDKEYIAGVKGVLKDGFFEEIPIFEPQKGAACYLVMELQSLPKKECSPSKCSGSAVVSSGVRIYENNNKVAESVNNGRFDFNDIDPENLSEFIALKAYENHLQSVSSHQSKLQ